MQPASSAQSAASTWTRPALASSETERLTVKEIMRGRSLRQLSEFVEMSQNAEAMCQAVEKKR